MGNIVSYLGQDDGEAAMNRLISASDEEPREEKANAAGEELSSDQEGDDMAVLEVLPIGGGGQSRKRATPSRLWLDQLDTAAVAAAGTSGTPPRFIWAPSMLPASSPMLSRDSPSPRQEDLSRETEEQQILPRSALVPLGTTQLHEVEAPATRRSSRGCSFFTRSLILASAMLSLVSTVLGVVTWKLLQEDLGADVAQNASAMLRLLAQHNASGGTAPRASSASTASGSPNDGAETILP